MDCAGHADAALRAIENSGEGGVNQNDLLSHQGIVDAGGRKEIMKDFGHHWSLGNLSHALYSLCCLKK